MNISLPGKLPEGWYPSDSEESAKRHEELQLELPPGHLLYGRNVSVVGHREGTDDILCRYSDDPTHFTVIHLSWCGHQEVNAAHPHVENDGTYLSFLEYEARFLGK